MSLISLYNAYLARGKDASKSILDRIHTLQPSKITLDTIAKKHPKCVSFLKDSNLGISLIDLLITENYRYADILIENEKDKSRLEQKLKNYDYNHNQNIFLLNQAADRIENSSYIKGIYSNLDKYSFLLLKYDTLYEFVQHKRLSN